MLRPVVARAVAVKICTLLIAAVLVAAFAPASVLATPPSPPFNQCPALGADTSCSRLIFIDNSGATVLTDGSQGPFDIIEDTLVGVLNTSGITIPGLPLTGSFIFAFDGDGVCGISPITGVPYVPRPSGCPFGVTGYEGPGTSFSIANPNSGTVNFAGGLAPGQSRWFTLESPPSTSLRIPTGKVTLSATEPTSGHFNDPVTFTAHLTNTCTGAAVSGATLTFTLDGQPGVPATTDALGNASATITPTEAAGTYTLTVSFAGSSSLLFSSATTSFMVTKEDTQLTSPTTLQVFAQGGTATLSSTLTDPANAAEGESSATPIAGQPVTMTLGSRAGSQSCTGTTNAAGVATCTISPLPVALGSQPITDSFVDSTNHYQSATNAEKALVCAFPAKGTFVVGNMPASGHVTFWESQWAKDNVLSGGAAPDAFKGFAENTSEPPACNKGWNTDPGNSADEPASIPSFLGTIVSSSINMSGSTTPAIRLASWLSRQNRATRTTPAIRVRALS